MTVLRQVTPDSVYPNPENPRMIFRQEEMDTLMTSIARHGIQVPITVYKDKERYILIDGERRWRCSKKLNLKKIPALVRVKPKPLENLLLMSNIHALREQWDYFTIATNLQKIIELWELEHKSIPNEIELSDATGLSRGQIRRCNLLLGLPDRFKEMLLEELQLPKSKQRISEDLFIEMEKALKTVTNRLPQYNHDIDYIRDVLVQKAKSGVISAVTDFRQLGKIATAIKNLNIEEEHVIIALDKVFNDNNANIKEAYKNTVEFEYDEKKALSQLFLLNDYFDEIIKEQQTSELDKDFIEQLSELYSRLRIVLEGYND